MLGVFAEFECSIIQQRVRAGLQRAKCEGKRYPGGSGGRHERVQDGGQVRRKPEQPLRLTTPTQGGLSGSENEFSPLLQKLG